MHDTSIRELILRLDATISGLRTDVQNVGTRVAAVEKDLNHVVHDVYNVQANLESTVSDVNYTILNVKNNINTNINDVKNTLNNLTTVMQNFVDEAGGMVDSDASFVVADSQVPSQETDFSVSTVNASIEVIEIDLD